MCIGLSGCCSDGIVRILSTVTVIKYVGSGGSCCINYKKGGGRESRCRGEGG